MGDYYTGVLLYADTCQADIRLEETDSGDKADVEPEPPTECIRALDLSTLEGLEQPVDSRAESIDLMTLDGIDPNNVMNNVTREGDWYLNGELYFDYVCTSPSVPDL